MDLWKRTSITTTIFKAVKALLPVILSLVILFVGKGLQEHNKQESYSQFYGFLEAVNAGQYDGKHFPPDIRVWSFEKCFDGSTYLYGKLDAYVFQGYTSQSSLVGRMDWHFDSYPNIPAEFVLQMVGFAGMIASIAWVVITKVLFKNYYSKIFFFDSLD